MRSRSDLNIAVGLLFAITFWGANNVAVKHLVQHWPPVWIGSSRMLCVGMLLFGLQHWTTWVGRPSFVDSTVNRSLWLRGSLILAAYIVVYTLAMMFTAPAHVALYFGTAPVWALFFEARPKADLESVRRYGAATLACTGIAILFWPKIQSVHADWRGDVLALVGCVIWVFYTRECKRLGEHLSSTEVTAHTMWRAGVWLAPVALWELARSGVKLQPDLLGIQAFSIVFSGTLAFILYNHALRHWPTSRVFLFGNLIPASTMIWAWLLLGDPVTPTFWVAMTFVAAGVILGQKIEIRILGNRWLPSE